MANLNRQQRRAAKYKKPQSERIVPLPSLIDEFTIFDIPTRIFDSIKNDALEVDADDEPVFTDNTGLKQEVVQCLGGWISTWQRISDNLKLNLSLTAMLDIKSRLHHRQTIPPKLIETAIDELNACRKVFRTQPRDEIQSIAKTSQIAIMLGAE